MAAASSAGHPARRGSSRLRLVGGADVLGGRVPFAALCCAVIVVTLLGVLLLNIQLSRGAYAAADLRRERTLLAEQEQALREDLAAAEAPESLRARAAALGMVPTEPAHIWLADAAVLGDAVPATAPPLPAEPVPAVPAPTEPAPTEPAPAEPAPTEPAPSGPTTPGSAP